MVDAPPVVDYARWPKLYVNSSDGGWTLIVSKATGRYFGTLRFKLLSGETP